jgi:putative two-component system response regulator
MNAQDTPQTILIVDDDPEELASTRKILEPRYTALTAASGEEALRIAREARPGAIILDVMMSGGRDGFAVFRELRNDPATKDIPVIFLTNVNRATGLPFDSGELGRYLGASPAAFLEKPASAGDLLPSLAKLANRSEGGG